MVADARRLGFPLLAGSSLPVTSRIPIVEVPLGAALEESVAIGWGAPDSYDFHALEAAQAMSERRAGGETGVRSIQAFRGAEVWDMLRQRPDTARLVEAALARSHTVQPPDGYTVAEPSIAWAARVTKDPVAYACEHSDGLRTSILLLDGFIKDFDYAGRLRGGDVISCQMYLPMPPHQSTISNFFNPLFNGIEEMMVTGKAPQPIERTLLTTGLVASAMESLAGGGVVVPTPELDIRYAAPANPRFWRT
jgi:hypothetical protein